MEPKKETSNCQRWIKNNTTVLTKLKTHMYTQTHNTFKEKIGENVQSSI